jgi:hypothetical protein
MDEGSTLGSLARLRERAGGRGERSPAGRLAIGPPGSMIRKAMIPFRTTRRPQRVPAVTLLLILVNKAVFPYQIGPGPHESIASSTPRTVTATTAIRRRRCGWASNPPATGRSDQPSCTAAFLHQNSHGGRCGCSDAASKGAAAWLLSATTSPACPGESRPLLANSIRPFRARRLGGDRRSPRRLHEDFRRAKVTLLVPSHRSLDLLGPGSPSPRSGSRFSSGRHRHPRVTQGQGGRHRLVGAHRRYVGRPPARPPVRRAPPRWPAKGRR